MLFECYKAKAYIFTVWHHVWLVLVTVNRIFSHTSNIAADSLLITFNIELLR